MSGAPNAPEAERSVLGRMLAEPETVSEIVSAGLVGEDFGHPAHRYLFDKVVESFYADDPIDPLSVGYITGPYIAKVLNVTEEQARQQVASLAAVTVSGRITDHAALVRRAADGRRLLDLTVSVQRDVQAGELPPEAIAGTLAQRAGQIATGAMSTNDLVSFADTGRAFVQGVEFDRAARAQGFDLGVKMGIGAIDMRTRGLQPTELLVGAGEPGVGKSGVWWRAALNFGERQMGKEKAKRIGTLVLSLEMGEKPSSQRVATMLSGVGTDGLREGTITDAELASIVDAWRRRVDMPVWFNYAASVRASQLRALVSEAVRRHNVGFVVIDHFRMFRMDRPPQNQVDHDEEKISFLKQMAKEMNLAIVCLAHTRKIDDPAGRPRPSDLRGSDQIRAHADFVNFLYRPALYADERQIESGAVSKTDATFIWAKNRHGDTADSDFFFEPARMSVW